MKLWSEAAREWGDEAVKKGDVVLLESRSFDSRYHIATNVTTDNADK